MKIQALRIEEGNLKVKVGELRKTGELSAEALLENTVLYFIR